MAWNNGFPMNYPQMYMPQPMPYQQPQQMQPTQMSGANQQPQMLTPPTIRAEIVQVDDEAAASAFPVGAGASQMMIARDESAIFIKSAMANGQTTLDVFKKRPPEPPAPKFDPNLYVRKDELEMLVSAALAAQQSEQATRTASVAARRASKKEDE